MAGTQIPNTVDSWTFEDIEGLPLGLAKLQNALKGPFEVFSGEHPAQGIAKAPIGTEISPDAQNALNAYGFKIVSPTR